MSAERDLNEGILEAELMPDTIKAPISCRDCDYIWEIDAPRGATIGEMFEILSGLKCPKCGGGGLGLHFGPRQTGDSTEFDLTKDGEI